MLHILGCFGADSYVATSCIGFSFLRVYLVKMQNPSTSNDPPPPTEPSNTGGISTAQFQLLMDEIKKNREDVQQRLDKLEGDVAAGQDNAAQIVVQKLKADRSYTFRKKGHEEQYRFNADIESHLNKAQGEAAKIHPSTEKERRSLEALKAQLQEGIQAIACRQKRIKVADRSDYGWAVVKAYDNDELASDSEDEKRLFKAEKTAEREISKRKRRSTKGKDVPAYQSTVVTQPIRAAPVSSGIMAGEPAGGTSSQPVSQWSQSTVRKIGPCFRPNKKHQALERIRANALCHTYQPVAVTITPLV